MRAVEATALLLLPLIACGPQRDAPDIRVRGTPKPSPSVIYRVAYAVRGDSDRAVISYQRPWSRRVRIERGQSLFWRKSFSHTTPPRGLFISVHTPENDRLHCTIRREKDEGHGASGVRTHFYGHGHCEGKLWTPRR